LHVGLPEDWQVAERQAERADGIPDAEKIDVDGLRIFQNPALFQRKVMLAIFPLGQELADCGSGAAPAVTRVDLADGERSASDQQTAFGNEAGQTSRGVGAAAEAEDEECVPRIVTIDEPLVGTNDFVVEAIAEHTAPRALAKPRAN